MTTRAEAKQQTREALLLAGMELFREHGIDSPSLDAICERAGKTRGAFYVHFADREAFQVAVLERILAAYLATIITTADPAGDLERSIVAFTDAALILAGGGAASPIGVLGSDQLRLLLQGAHRVPQVKQRFVALIGFAIAQLSTLIAAGQAGGRIRADIAPEALAVVLVGEVFGILALLETGVPAVHDVERVRDALLGMIRPT